MTGKNRCLVDLGTLATRGKFLNYIFGGQLGRERSCRRLLEVLSVLKILGGH